MGLAVTLVLLLAGELLLRLLGFPRTELHPWQQPDPEVLWSLRPGADATLPRFHGGSWRIRTDARGFRMPGLRPPLTRPLVLCIGDSVTMGFGVDDDEAYPAVLEEILRGAAGLGGTRVVNAACAGHSSEQVKVRLSRLLPELAPDVLVVCAGINDDWMADAADADVLAGRGDLQRLQRLLGRSRIYATLRAQIVRAKLRRADARRPDPRVDPERYRGNLEAIAAMARRQGTAPIFVPPPARSAASQGNWAVRIHAPLCLYQSVMTGVAQREGIPLVEHPLLAGRSKEGRRLFMDWCHPEAEGHCLLAQELAPWVEDALRRRGP